MSNAPILFFGRNPAILALVTHQISAKGHAVEGYLDEKELDLRLRRGAVSLVVLGVGVEPAPRERCRAVCKELGIRMMEHEGGPDALVRNIEAALAERPA